MDDVNQELSAEAIRAGLGTRWLGCTLEMREQSDSTMDDVRAAAARGAQHGHVVIADSQRHGRGARGTIWESPAGENIYLSFLCTRSVLLNFGVPLTLIVGAALRHAVAQLSKKTNVEIKWPNDILIGDRKCAGILVEARTVDGVNVAVVGIGLNVNRRHWSEALSGTATSLALENGFPMNRNQIASELLNVLESEIEHWLERPSAELIALLNQHLAWRDRAVRVDEHVGRIAGINAKGELELATDAGIVSVQSGHIVPVA